MIKKFEHKNQTGTLFNRHHEKRPEIPGLLFWANGTELPFGGSFFLWCKAMKIIKAAAVYAAEQCLRTPRGEVYSFLATGLLLLLYAFLVVGFESFPCELEF